MDIHTAMEESYKNGYRKGYEDGKNVSARRGRWNKRQFEDDSIAYRCSECRTTWIWDTKYCPYCGADMR